MLTLTLSGQQLLLVLYYNCYLELVIFNELHIYMCICAGGGKDAGNNMSVSKRGKFGISAVSLCRDASKKRAELLVSWSPEPHTRASTASGGGGVAVATKASNITNDTHSNTKITLNPTGEGEDDKVQEEETSPLGKEARENTHR